MSSVNNMIDNISVTDACDVLSVDMVQGFMRELMQIFNNPVNPAKNRLVKPSKFDIAEVASKMLWHRREPFAKSTDIGKYFGMNHKDLLRKIEGFYSFDDLISRRKIAPRKRVVRGKEYPYYEMDADAFAFICLSMTGAKAEKFKWAFIEAFKVATRNALENKLRVELNQELEPFVKLRNEGKTVRLDFTNTMNRLCDYAEESRGSSYNGRCPFYPMYTRLIYKTLGLSAPTAGAYNVRDLSVENVKRIEEREIEVAEAVNEMIDGCTEYHDIYKWIKAHIEELWL